MAQNTVLKEEFDEQSGYDFDLIGKNAIGGSKHQARILDEEQQKDETLNKINSLENFVAATATPAATVTSNASGIENAKQFVDLVTGESFSVEDADVEDQVTIAAILDLFARGANEDEIVAILGATLTSMTSRIAKDKNKAKRYLAHLIELMSVMELMLRNKNQSPELQARLRQMQEKLSVLMKQNDIKQIQEFLKSRELADTLNQITRAVRQNIDALLATLLAVRKVAQEMAQQQLKLNPKLQQQIMDRLQRDSLTAAMQLLKDAFNKISQELQKENDPAKQKQLLEAINKILDQANNIKQMLERSQKQALDSTKMADTMKAITQASRTLENIMSSLRLSSQLQSSLQSINSRLAQLNNELAAKHAQLQRINPAEIAERVRQSVLQNEINARQQQLQQRLNNPADIAERIRQSALTSELARQSQQAMLLQQQQRQNNPAELAEKARQSELAAKQAQLQQQKVNPEELAERARLAQQSQKVVELNSRTTAAEQAQQAAQKAELAARTEAQKAAELRTTEAAKNPQTANPTVTNPSLVNPALANPALINPAVVNPNIANPNLAQNPALIPNPAAIAQNPANNPNLVAQQAQQAQQQNLVTNNLAVNAQKGIVENFAQQAKELMNKTAAEIKEALGDKKAPGTCGECGGGKGCCSKGFMEKARDNIERVANKVIDKIAEKVGIVRVEAEPPSKHAEIRERIAETQKVKAGQQEFEKIVSTPAPEITAAKENLTQAMGQNAQGMKAASDEQAARDAQMQALLAGGLAGGGVKTAVVPPPPTSVTPIADPVNVSGSAIHQRQ